MVCAICNKLDGHSPWCTRSPVPLDYAPDERRPTSAERYAGFEVGAVYGRADADVAPTRTVDDIRREREGAVVYPYCPLHDAHHTPEGATCRAFGEPCTAEEAVAAAEDPVAAARAHAASAGLNPKDLVGAVKTPLGLLPWTALVQVAKVFAVGARKYGAYNWRTKGQPVQHVTYVEAAFRHLAAYMDGQTIDPETGCNHLAHAACGLLILLDASAVGNAIDNRPTPGNAAEIMALKPE